MSYGPSDYTGVTFAVRGTLYFDGGATPERRAGIATCFEQFQAVAGPHLTWLLRDEPPKGPSEIPYSKAKPIRSMIEDMAPNDAANFTYHSGDQARDAGFYLFDVQCRRAWQAQMPRNGLDVLQFALPLADVIEHPTRFQSLFVSFFETLKAFHGRGGLGFVLSHTDPDENQPTEAFMVKDLLGVDVSEPIEPWVMTRDVIKSVNWLTGIDGVLAKKLGGVNGLRSELPPAWFAFYTLHDGGVVIQAGNEPDAAPRALDSHPPLLTLVNAALRELRAPDLGALHYQGSSKGEPRLLTVSTTAWAKRLDVSDDELLDVKERLLKVSKLDAAHTWPGKG